MKWAVVTAGVLVAATAGCSNGSDSGSATPGASPTETASESPTPTPTAVGKPNGVEKLGPRKVLNQAREAALEARSVNMVGTSPAASLNLIVTKNSSNGTRSAGETTLQTRVVDGVIYVRGDQAYWTEAFSKKKAKRIGDKWVAGELSNPKLASFKQTSTMKPLMDQFLTLNGEGQVGEVGQAQGQPAVPVTSASGTTWVATTGKPYVLLITSSPETGEDATVEFTSWNKKVVIKAPPKKKTISLASLA